jgi:SAM-dependent methyltransferase
MHQPNARVGLTQRGRAGLECLGTMQKFASGTLRGAARRRFSQDPEGAALDDAWAASAASAPREALAEMVTTATAIARRCSLFRLERFCQAQVAAGIYELGIPAIEERRAAFERAAEASDRTSPATLELDPDLAFPAYYTSADWHLRPGGWEGYDLYGPLGMHVIPLIFRHGGVAAVPVGGDIARHRSDVVRQLPKDRYERIYERGWGGISTVRAFAGVFPDAELTGSDLSPILLRQGQAACAATGLRARFKQRDAATDTREPDESFDAVVVFAVQHELPLEANRSLFREMFRILRPGGDIVLSDPPPFRAVPPFHAAILDWDTENRGEPFFSSACLSDWGQELADAGFIDVSAYALGPDCYPWVTLARKAKEAVLF